MAQRTFLGQIKQLQDKLEELQESVLEDVVDQIVWSSPDDTGAYVLSHSIGRSGNVGYSISSADRPSAPGAHRSEAWRNLMSQVDSIPRNQTRIWVGNNAPHASAVEFGGPNWRRGGYYVYSTLKNVFPSLIESAKSRVGLK